MNMPNIPEILRTIFHSVNADGEISGPTYGVCVYDCHGKSYCDSIEDLETLIDMSPGDLVSLATDAGPCGADIVEDVLAFGSPIFIDNVPYRLIPSEDGFVVSRIEERKNV